MVSAAQVTCETCGSIHPEGAACGGLTDGRIGTIVNKYRIVRLLGRGGMGSVYEAQHIALRRRFAVKFMLPEYATNRTTLHRFENEARAAGGLEHANIAAVTDIGQAPDGSPYLVMEYLSGEDGSKLLARLGPLPVPRAANIVFQACLGLAVAHKAGIIHRDIKPENLLIADAGDGNDLVKILDFGIAKLRSPDASVATASGMMMGTFFYMSPEQVRDAAKVDPRTDAWALGVVLYELLTGEKPFNGAEPTEILYQIVHESPVTPEKLRPGLPPDLVTVIGQALQKDIERRLPSVSALAQALAPFTGRPSARPMEPSANGTLETQPVPATAPAPVHPTTSHAAVSTISKISPPESTTKPKPGRSIAIAGTALVIIIAAVGLLFIRINGGSQPNAASRLTTDKPSASARASAVPAAHLASAAASLGQPSAPAFSAVASASSNSANVRTMSEQAGPSSVKVHGATAGKAAARSIGSRTAESAAKNNTGLTPLQGKPAAPTHAPISIDTEAPY